MNTNDIIRNFKEEMQSFKEKVKRDMQIEKMNGENVITGTVYRYIIKAGFHGVMVIPDESPAGVDPAEVYLLGAPVERGLNGAIIPLEQSPEELKQMFGDVFNEIRGQRVMVKFYGTKPFTGTASLVNNFNKEDPGMLIRPERCMNMLISVSAE